MCATLPLAAQTTKLPQIKPQDPELHYAFLRAHTNIDLKIQASTTAAASSLSASTATLYGISAADLPKLTAEVRKFNVNLGAWFLDQQNYLYQQQKAKNKPDMKTLVNYQWRRQRLVMNAHAGIRAAVSKTSWTGLRTYINGPFATALQTTQGAGK